MRRQHRERPRREPSLLILRCGGIRRFVAGVPAYRALRRAFPRHRTVLATSGWLRPLVALTDALDDVLPARPPLSGLAWAGPSPDVAVNLHDAGPASHLLLHALWPARTIAFASPAAPDGLEGPAWRDDEPENVRWCRLLESFGIPADPADGLLSPPPAPCPAPGAVMVHTGTPDGRVPWPVRNYAEVVRLLRDAGHEVVVTGWGVPGSSADATTVGLRDVPEADHITDLGALAALVAGCSLVVCGDPEMEALARAYGKATIVADGGDASRSGTEVDDVLTRAERLLSGAPAAATLRVVGSPHPAARVRAAASPVRPAVPAATDRGRRPLA